MQCPKCNNDISITDKYCGKCGFDLKEINEMYALCSTYEKISSMNLFVINGILIFSRVAAYSALSFFNFLSRISNDYSVTSVSTHLMTGLVIIYTILSLLFYTNAYKCSKSDDIKKGLDYCSTLLLLLVLLLVVICFFGLSKNSFIF